MVETWLMRHYTVNTTCCALSMFMSPPFLLLTAGDSPLSMTPCSILGKAFRTVDTRLLRISLQSIVKAGKRFL
jgi:hypothetical protein